jgi:hypothetical protein
MMIELILKTPAPRVISQVRLKRRLNEMLLHGGISNWQWAAPRCWEGLDSVKIVVPSDADAMFAKLGWDP